MSANPSKGFALLILLGALVSSLGADIAPGRMMLHGHVPKVLARLKPVGRLPAATNLSLAIGLPLRNTAALDEFMRQLYDPRSPGFRQFLTPEEFTARFGPTEADYAAVKNFARANGLVVTATYGNRLLLDVSGPVASVEKAFNLTLRTYRHPTENRDFFAPDTEPSVDANLPIADVSGLDNFSLPHPKLRVMVAKASPHAGSSPDGTYLGNDFRAAYVPGSALDGSGQAVGLLQFDGFYTNDIISYENLAGRTNIPLQTVLLDSVSGTPGFSGIANANIEVSLDIEMSISMAPGLARVVVFEGNSQNDILNAMAASNTVKNLSSSWSWNSGPSTTTDNIFTNMAAEGQSYFNASGDSDAFTAGAADAEAPSSSPIVTQVGGTTLTMNGAGTSYFSETAWNRGGGVGSSGGISTYYAIPAWQQGVNSFLSNGGSTTARNVPDVAMVGDNVFVRYGNGSSNDVGGTSCAAPLWAGFMALVNQQAAAGGKPAVGFINPAVYEIANESIYNSAFNDITVGNNTSSSSPNAFYAVPGYDLCTGVGTPAGTNLINALVNPDALTVISNGGFNAVCSPAGAFNITAQTFFLTNAGASPLAWSLNNTSSWLNVSTNGGTLAAGAGSSVVVSLNTVASNLNTGTYTASVSFSNATSGVAHSRFFTLTVDDPLVILPTNSFYFIGSSGGPFAPASQSVILTNERSGSLNWGINNTSAWLNVSTTSGSLSSGAQTSLTITLAPAATNLANGTYNATLLVTNTTSQFVQPVTVSVLVGQSLVQNGGFETGDFTSWTLNGSGGGDNFVAGSSTISGLTPHTGSYYAALGQLGSLAYLSQTLPTLPGQLYLLSLWLNSSSDPYSGHGTTPNEFSVSWNGNTLFDKTNVGKLGWTNLQFVVSANSVNTLLKFGARDDPYYLGLDDVTLTPGFAPSISVQPTNSLTILSGGNAVFSTVAGGSTPLVYQWRKNGINISNGGGISGATSNVLTLASVTTNSAANYTLLITNVFGAATSSVAALTVVLPPTLTSAPTNHTVECGSNNITFVAAATGTPPLNFQWSLDGTPVSGATNTSFSLTNVHLPNHTITVLVTNLYASISSNALLTVHDTTAPVITLNGGNPIFLELGGAFTDPGATANDTCAGSVSVATSGTVNTGAVGTNTLTYTSADGNGNTNTATRAVIVHDTTPPTILWSFTNLVLATGTNCTAPMPDVTGTNFILATDLSGALTVSQIPTNHSGLPLGTNIVFISVADASGNTASSTNTIIVQDQTPPQIFSQPQSQTNVIGATANFSVFATACTPLAFQWFFNNSPLASQTNCTLSISNLNLALAGNYSVIATASGGSTTSSVAVLTVNLIFPSIAIASSENPSGYRDNINFTATMTPSNAGGMIQFLTNDFAFDAEILSAGQTASTNLASLPRGKNLVTAIYSGDSNDLPATNTFAQIVTNHPPAATDFSAKRFGGLPLKISVSALSSNWNDPDGDIVSLAAIGISTNGVTVTNNSGTLVYCNSNNVDDQFVCTIADGFGGTNFQNVNITFIPLPQAAVPSITGLAQDNNGDIMLNLAGASGFTYVLETTTNLLFPGGWLPVATNVLGTNGTWQFNDTATNNPQQFYRLKLVP